ncbi:MAG: glycosyltransferase family 1 protein [Chitinophagales bacterium]|nr:glycosyltransferase family 1 protein [Chitinophagales bacterium]
MRIAVNTRFLLKNRLEGIGWFTYETLKRITTAHPEVEFHFLFDRPYDQNFIFGANVRAHVLFPPARHPFLWYWWFEWSVPKALNKIQPDLFVSTDGYLSLSTPIPTLIVMHDLAFEHYPQHVPFLVRKYYQHFSPLYARKATRIATVSNYSKQDIVKHYGISAEKIDVTLNGVNDRYLYLEPHQIEAAQQKYTQGKPYFIYAGSINPRKNIPNLLRAFERFKSQTESDTQLVIAGAKGWGYEEVFEVKEAMTFGKEVIFTGHLSSEDLSALVGGAIAMTYVSLFEGFGIPLIEAMQAGVPVITSNVSSLPEVAGDAALLVSPNDIGDIADAMYRLYANPELRRDLAAKGKVQAVQFSWDLTAQRLWQSIEKALAS